MALKDWEFQLESMGLFGNDYRNLKHFKTKSQALRFAKQYMKTH